MKKIKKLKHFLQKSIQNFFLFFCKVECVENSRENFQGSVSITNQSAASFFSFSNSNFLFHFCFVILSPRPFSFSLYFFHSSVLCFFLCVFSSLFFLASCSFVRLSSDLSACISFCSFFLSILYVWQNLSIFCPFCVIFSLFSLPSAHRGIAP